VPDRRRRIAVINDDPAFLTLVEQVLESNDAYEAYTYREQDISLGELRAIRPDLILIDVIVADLPSGWELALVAAADQHLGPVPIIITSPRVPGLARRVDELREVANVHVVSKPFTLEELRGAVHTALAGSDAADRGTAEPI
jgi:DNA-binding response OmpR family regulator